MENDPKTDPYAAVLADLRARRQKIDNTIALLEQIRAGGLPGLAEAPEQVPEGPAAASHSPIPETGPGAFFGMTIHDAAKKLLNSHRRQMHTSEIVSELERGGIVLTSADKSNTVGSILLRRFYNVGDIVRVGRGLWGLQEWYPGRKFPKGKSGESQKPDEQNENGVGNSQGTVADQPRAGSADWMLRDIVSRAESGEFDKGEGGAA